MLPPLTALRTFEVAARHLSFTKAAEELCVTQSAVSRQIRVLEDFLEIRLFERRHRAVVLTADGEHYKRDLSQLFAQLDRATRRLSRRQTREILNIQAYTTFAMRWLIPRLKRFQDQNPDIRVHLTASLQPVDFANSDIHGAVRGGYGEWPYRADRLCDTYIVPVCCPSLAEQPWPLREPRDLVHATLLHSFGRPSDWSDWFRGVGLPEIGAEQGHRFESSSMAYQAAQLGLGVAIGQRFLVEDDLRKGKLVAPFDAAVHSEETYYFLSSPRFAGAPVLELFREWLLQEAGITAAAQRQPLPRRAAPR
ncbi:LysR family transcriptional regulator, glycine cleavage system transcriptional activator [Tistlia consotensis]|uniref:LysR family transcriptional regulator, glycine cleavage system transcriptional activator n=1 Tax=Tistlia consotensis USBA 355 TaxID=560819 RepID=A0A1Y6BY45_9PROT|nr:transcriptional regulator GcvA [Tistlia consotensis]SMF35523.1 LysR family transcriptional regulator, glycine cleavage system transcriptional activator [Tistlia consotensis USBA 355]SNR70866.1 LysR family transcriptional regulator, glycine cleavage system transcriptional activator [Tistlia consotensis]